MTSPFHVAVLMGGGSHERQVSLSSGEACAKALERGGHRVTRIDVDRNIAVTLDRLRPDIVFNALHGPFGEDGTIQGVLEIMQIPYTHSGVAASALAMDKHKTKLVLKDAGMPVAEDLIMRRDRLGTQHPMAPPYVAKPLAEGSSFGVVIVAEGANGPPPAIAGDPRFGHEIMIERFIPGRELTCAVLGEEASEVCEIKPLVSSSYDYAAKYEKGGSLHTIPAEISPFVYQEVRKLSLLAHRALGCRTISRSDFRYDDRGSGDLVFLEINTQPGMTETSLVPDLVAAGGGEFDALVMMICAGASLEKEDVSLEAEHADIDNSGR